MGKAISKIFLVSIFIMIMSFASIGAWASVDFNQPIYPVIETNKDRALVGDYVDLSLKLTNVPEGAKTNSCTFTMEFDKETFDFATGDVQTSIESTNFNFTRKYVREDGHKKIVTAMFTDMGDEINLTNNMQVYKLRLLVKSNTALGTKTFSLLPVDMVDKAFNVYNVNYSGVYSKQIEIVNDLPIEGSISLNLGEIFTSLSDEIRGNLNQEKLNEMFGKIKFVVKRADGQVVTTYTGSQILVPDVNGNIARIEQVYGSRWSDYYGWQWDWYNTVTAKFRLLNTDMYAASITICGAGIYEKTIPMKLNFQSVYYVNEGNTIDLYAGDIASVSYSTIVDGQDAKVDNIDFSQWLKLHGEYIADNTKYDYVVDFNRDGIITNMDFTMWLYYYDKLNNQ